MKQSLVCMANKANSNELLNLDSIHYHWISLSYSSLVDKLIDIDNNCIKSLINNIKKDYYSDNYNGNIKNNLRKRLGLLYTKSSINFSIKVRNSFFEISRNICL